MFKKLLNISLLTLLIGSFALVPSYGQSKKKKKKKKKTDDISQVVRQESNDPIVTEVFIEATRAKMLGKDEEAIEKFKDIMKMDGNNAAAAYELAKYSYEAKDFDEALNYANTAASLDPSNKWYQFFYAEILAMNNDFESAAEVYRGLVRQYPDNIEYYFDLAYMLTKTGEFEEAIEAYDQLEQRMGINEDIIFQKQRLYIQENKVDKAIGEIQKLINEYPDEPRYYSILADLYDANGRQDEAYEVYQKLVELDPENPFVQLSLANWYRKQGNDEQYIATINKAFANPSVPIDAKVQILMPYIDWIRMDESKKAEGFMLAEKIVEAHPEEAKAHAIRGDLYYMDEQNEKALESYEKASSLDGSVFTVWQQMLFILSDTRQYDKLIDVSKEVISLYPNQAMPYYFNGIAHNVRKNHEKAKKSLKRAIMIGSDNPALIADLHTQLGDVYNSLKEFEKSDKSFDKALELDSENPYTLNNYSYYLSLRGEKLEQAADMSEKSNKLEPNNPSFQDTYGWVLYKMEKYKDAKEWLEKALSNTDGKRPVILEHLGDAYFQLGDNNKALEYWQKAKENGGDSPELLQKITDKMLQKR